MGNVDGQLCPAGPLGSSRKPVPPNPSISLYLPSRSKRRSRRLRKKRRLGEFKELGFPLAIQLVQGLNDDTQVTLWHALIVELIEPRGLAFGGGDSGYITRVGRNSATDEDRRAVVSWLRTRPEVVSVDAGPLEDAWYGHDERALYPSFKPSVLGKPRPAAQLQLRASESEGSRE